MQTKKLTGIFTAPEADMLLNLVLAAEEYGSYYGNKEQYFNRLDNVKKKLNLMFTVSQEDYD